MRAVYLLSISALSGRRTRTVLLVSAVALATALVGAVSCAMSSLSAGMAERVMSSLGAADIRISHIGEQRFDDSVLGAAEGMDGVEVVVPRLRAPLSVRHPLTKVGETLIGVGIDPALEYGLVEGEVGSGAPVRGELDLVLDIATAERLGVGVGDELDVVHWGDPIALTVSGIAGGGSVQFITRPEATVHISTLEAISGYAGMLSEVLIKVDDPMRAEEIAAAISEDLPESLSADPTTKITSGISNSMAANRFGFLLISVLAYIAAAFIVLTGLTTNMLERRRELAILRCIGSDRVTIALAQMVVGGVVGLGGAVVGVPLGVGLGLLMAGVYPDRFPAGLVISPGGLGIAAAGSVVAGLLGAVWPAVSAARTSPLRSLSVRAQQPRRREIVALTVLGVLGLVAQVVIVGAPDDGQVLFWGYVTAGLPAMFVGYFLVGAAVVLGVTGLLGGLIEKVLGLPRGLLAASVRATPFRFGFTAGALMVGLAMLTAVWTNGRALTQDWLGSLEFPEAFVHGWSGIDPETKERIDALPWVTDTCAITLQRIEDDTFGVKAFNKGIGTTFVAFEPGPLFRMVKLSWIEGDPETARAKLEAGGAVLVAKEFTVAAGYGVGDTYRTAFRGEELAFEIVGVVSSPGLDIVNKYFDIGKEYANQAVHSVFGTRADLERIFGVDSIDLVQVATDGTMSDAEVTDGLRAVMGNTPAAVGAGREILEDIVSIARGTMWVATVVALFAMAIGCLGVANIVAAGIDARRYEFGVLRAIGGARGMVGRLIVGEVLVVGLAASVLGTGLGLQGAWAGQRLNRLLAGLELEMRPDFGAIALGALALIVMSLIFALPAVRGVVRTGTRELLMTARG